MELAITILAWSVVVIVAAYAIYIAFTIAMAIGIVRSVLKGASRKDPK